MHDFLDSTTSYAAGVSGVSGIGFCVNLPIWTQRCLEQ